MNTSKLPILTDKPFSQMEGNSKKYTSMSNVNYTIKLGILYLITSITSNFFPMTAS